MTLRGKRDQRRLRTDRNRKPILRARPALRPGQERPSTPVLYRDWWIADGGDGWLYGTKAGAPTFRGRTSVSVEQQIDAHRQGQMRARIG